MSELSPGPWGARNHERDKNSWDVYDVNGATILRGYWSRTGEADARIAAAAPELLEALKAIAKGEGRYDRDPLEHAANTIDDMKALAVAAIAKAEGS